MLNAPAQKVRPEVTLIATALLGDGFPLPVAYALAVGLWTRANDLDRERLRVQKTPGFAARWVRDAMSADVWRRVLDDVLGSER